MAIDRRSILTLPFALLASSCALFGGGTVQDDDTVDDKAGYLFVVPHLTPPLEGISSPDPDLTAIELTRVDIDGGRFPQLFSIDGNEPAVLRTMPGVYYLSSAARVQLTPRFSIFEVKAGQMNYAGDWSVANLVVGGSAIGNGTMGGAFYEVRRAQTRTTLDPHVDDLYQQRFPKLAKRLKLVSTKLTLPPPPGNPAG